MRGSFQNGRSVTRLTANQKIIVASPTTFERFGHRSPLLKNTLELEHLVLEGCNLFRDDDEVGVVAEQENAQRRDECRELVIFVIAENPRSSLEHAALEFTFSDLHRALDLTFEPAEVVHSGRSFVVAAGQTRFQNCSEDIHNASAKAASTVNLPRSIGNADISQSSGLKPSLAS